MKKNTILHITPHLGGGVGRFFNNVFSDDLKYEHKYALLENPIDKNLLPDKEEWFIVESFDQINKYVKDAIIVQIEFWNHPLLYNFLSEIDKLSECRIILYSHVSGLFPPAYFPINVARVADLTIFSTYAAILSDAAKEQNGVYSVIPEFGGAKRTLTISRRKHSDFRVLYIGTADFLKMHPELIKWCIELHRIDKEISFTFCTQDSSQHIRRQVPNAFLKAFDFFEKVEDISEMMSISDVFGYALQPRHYGTGEQVLLEAMGAGLVPVVLNNPAECFIVKHGVNGIVAKNHFEYIESILFLKKNPEIKNIFSSNAKEYAKNMSAEKTRMRFHLEYQNIICKFTKKKHYFPVNSKWDMFLLSQGSDSEIFKGSLDEKDLLLKFYRWQLSFFRDHLSISKGTIAQWNKYFPGEVNLMKLKELIESIV